VLGRGVVGGARGDVLRQCEQLRNPPLVQLVLAADEIGETGDPHAVP
jgi:hypothetical protein